MSGWIGVDLDGTLAQYNSGDGVETIGAPVSAMLERVKRWIAEGYEVRIMTARVAPVGHSFADVERQMNMIEDWCEKHIGMPLSVTATKDYNMIELWDDRAITVEKNTGRVLVPGWMEDR